MDLAHQRHVDRQAAGGVEDHHVVDLAPAHIHRAVGDLQRRLAEDDGQAADAGTLSELLELELGGGALGVEAGEKHPLAVAFRQAQRDLAGGGGLARALQADHQDGDRRRGVEVEGHGTLAAQGLNQHVVDDLDDLLARGDGGEHFLADGAVADLGDEILDHVERHVGIEQREADLAQGLHDIGLVQRAALAELVEDARELAGQGLEHGGGLQNNDAPLREHSRSGGVVGGVYGRDGARKSSGRAVGRPGGGYPPPSSLTTPSQKPSGAPGSAGRRDGWRILDKMNRRSKSVSGQGRIVS